MLDGIDDCVMIHVLFLAVFAIPDIPDITAKVNTSLVIRRLVRMEEFAGKSTR